MCGVALGVFSSKLRKYQTLGNTKICKANENSDLRDDVNLLDTMFLLLSGFVK
jgi:hypothetical protein